MPRHIRQILFSFSATILDFWIYPFASAIVLVVAMPPTAVPTATTVASLPVPVAAGNVSGACLGAAFASPQFLPMLRLGIRLPFKSERF